MTPPARLTDEQKAELAFEAHAALLRTEADTPKLRSNPFWQILRQDSFEGFYLALDKLV